MIQRSNLFCFACLLTGLLMIGTESVFADEVSIGYVVDVLVQTDNTCPQGAGFPIHGAGVNVKFGSTSRAQRTANVSIPYEKLLPQLDESSKAIREAEEATLDVQKTLAPLDTLTLWRDGKWRGVGPEELFGSDYFEELLQRARLRYREAWELAKEKWLRAKELSPGLYIPDHFADDNPSEIFDEYSGWQMEWYPASLPYEPK